MYEVVNKGVKHELTGEYLEPVHVGRILKELLNDYNVSQSRLSIVMRVPFVAINEVCNGKRNLSPEMATRLGKVFGGLGMDTEYWMNIQRRHDELTARIKLEKELELIQSIEDTDLLDEVEATQLRV